MQFIITIKDQAKAYKNKKLKSFVAFLKNRLKLTANFLTVISFLTGIISFFFLFENHLYFNVFIILSLIFDILDGALARIEAKKGKDWILDLASDRSVMLLLLIKSYMVLELPIMMTVLIVYIGLTILLIILPYLYKKEIKYIYMIGGFYGFYIFKMYDWGIYTLLIFMSLSLVFLIPQVLSGRSNKPHNSGGSKSK